MYHLIQRFKSDETVAGLSEFKLPARVFGERCSVTSQPAYKVQIPGEINWFEDSLNKDFNGIIDNILKSLDDNDNVVTVELKDPKDVGCVRAQYPI
jgi:hypothetical protein